MRAFIRALCLSMIAVMTAAGIAVGTTWSTDWWSSSEWSHVVTSGYTRHWTNDSVMHQMQITFDAAHAAKMHDNRNAGY